MKIDDIYLEPDIANNYNYIIGKKIGHALVKEKLAACVNVIPGLTSIYEWEGRMEEDSEALLKIKTKTSLINNVTDEVKKLHSYDTPEVIATPITGGNQKYIDCKLLFDVILQYLLYYYRVYYISISYRRTNLSFKNINLP